MGSGGGEHWYLLEKSLAAPFYLAAAIIILTIVAKAWTTASVTDDDDPPPLCPFPNCVRCRRYVQVQQNAQRKLSWIVHSLTKKSSENLLQRVVDGVNGGSRYMDEIGTALKAVERSDSISPSRGQYPTVLLIPGLSTSAPLVSTLNQNHLESCRLLENNVEMIRTEYLAGCQTSEGADSSSLTWLENNSASSTAPWKVCHLQNQGVWVPQPLFPRTLATIRQLPVLDRCCFGNVLFSRVSPGSDIPPHCGPTNARHRLHLTIVSPKTASTYSPRLWVRDEFTQWQESKAWAFDDSFRHSVEYPETSADVCAKDQCRVVLIVDVWHPELTELERVAIRDLYPAATILNS